MKTLHFFCLLSLLSQIALAETDPTGYMTSRDLMHNDASSNLSLRNNRNIATNVYGLYIRQYAYVTPGATCASATSIFTGNLTAGAYVSPVTINAGKSVAIGSNYLYNMILNAIYYENIIFPSSPPGCALPGCTWGTDSTKYNWCIFLGALAPAGNSSSYTSTVPPATDAASGSGYNYNLVSTYHYLGPITCSDETLSCTTATQQVQDFS